MKDKSISISTSAFFSFFPLFILLLRASMKQKTSKDHNSQMVSSLEQPLLHTKYVSSSSCLLNCVVSLFFRLFPYCRHKLKEQFLKMVRISAIGMFSIAFKTRNATGLVAPAIAVGLGALTDTLGTLVPVIGASGFATAAAITIIGTIVGSFR